MTTLDPSGHADRASRWGILPAYHSWQGEVVTTDPQVEAAILDAMGAEQDQPPELHVPPLAEGDRCEIGPDRAWGWAVQLYALRSRESWGVGDFADLRNFGRWASKTGASVILLNPLGAQVPKLPYQPSPYYASSRRFRNLVYLRPEDVEGARNVDISSERDAALRLNAERLIDYDRVFQVKTAALRKIHAAAPNPRGLASYVRRQGAALRDFADFNARHTTDRAADEVPFQMWLQFHLEHQLSRASHEIGLIIDVPVGFASDGFDAWRWREFLAPHMRVGAPPDEFFRDGQDWGLPPFNPWQLEKAGWEPFIDAIRSAGRHSAGIRLDHVMSLFRLFWIPEGVPPTKGAYVHYPASILLRLLASESRRAGAFVIGEDLGLVEPVVRKQLAEVGSLSYRLVWFEPSDPSEWPHDAVAAIGTHDLPTVAGIWTHTEPEKRLHDLRQKLVHLTHMPDDADPIDVTVAVYAHLARGRTRIVLASLEDALGVHERPNVPGTTAEFPNWRLSLTMPLEDITNQSGVTRIVSEMAEAGRAASPRPHRSGSPSRG